MTRKLIRVVIGGDICPIGLNEPYFIGGDAGSVFNDLLPEFENADLSIANLECPLINKKNPIEKAGPVLGVSSDSINGLKNASIDILNLGNNHIMDHGSEGLFNTLTLCSKAGIKTVGAGENLQEARKILIVKIGGVSIGILSLAEHEFSIATKNLCGANPLDLADFVRNMKSNSPLIDYLIVLVHGGNEHYPYPSPRLKDTCRFMIEMGAKAVVVQHTHCPGCFEEYQGSHIVYGQGNLIFDLPGQKSSFYEGFLVKLLIPDHLNASMELVPFVQPTDQPGVKKMAIDDARLFLQLVQERSLAIQNDEFVKLKWDQFCENRKHDYLRRIIGHNRFCSRIFSFKYRKHFKVDSYCRSEYLNRLLNTISCESHREAVENILNHRSINDWGNFGRENDK